MDRAEIAPTVLRQITQAVRSLRYGTVQITVHDARIVQIDKVEKVRIVPSADLTPGGHSTTTPSDRIPGGIRLSDGP